MFYKDVHRAVGLQRKLRKNFDVIEALESRGVVRRLQFTYLRSSQLALLISMLSRNDL